MIKWPIFAAILMLAINVNAEYRLDPSLTDAQMAVFKSDMTHLLSFKPTTTNTDLLLLSNAYKLDGRALYDLMTNQLIAVVSDTFTPTLCLHGETVEELAADSSSGARKLIEGLKSGKVARCTPMNKMADTIKIEALPKTGNFIDIASVFSGYQFYEDIGIKGGLFFSDGLFLPQNFPQQKILVLNSKLSKDFQPLPNIGQIALGEKAMSYVRIADYLSESLGEGKLRKCQSMLGQEFECDPNSAGKYSLLGVLLLFFADNCATCTRAELTTMRFIGTKSLSLATGYYKSRILINETLAKWKDDFAHFKVNVQPLLSY